VTPRSDTHLKLGKEFGRRSRRELANAGRLDVPHTIITSRNFRLSIRALAVGLLGAIICKQRGPKRVREGLQLRRWRVQDDLRNANQPGPSFSLTAMAHLLERMEEKNPL
jgi:hypothetical protein